LEEKKKFNELHRYPNSEDALNTTPRFASPSLSDEEKLENMEREKSFDIMNEEATQAELQNVLNEFSDVMDRLAGKTSISETHMVLTEDGGDPNARLSQSLLDSISRDFTPIANPSKGKEKAMG
jgi:hypothetical protein